MKQEISQSTKKAWWTSRVEGFSIVEVVLAGSVFVLLTIAFAGIYIYGEESSTLSGARQRAVMLAREGIEATKNIKDADFANLSDGVHGISASGGIWSFAGVQDVTDIFTREIVISSLDGYRKSVTSNVFWTQNAQRAGSISLSTRLTNWVRTVLGDWSNPIESQGVNISGNNDGFRIAVSGDYAYVVMNGGGPDFVIFDITNPDSPVQVGGLTLGGTLTDVKVTGDYVYLSSTQNGEELKIIDVSNRALPIQVGFYNLSGGADAQALDINGDTLYVGRESSNTDELSVFDITNRTNPILQGSLNLGAGALEIKYLNNYVYIASESNLQELQVANVTNPNAPAFTSFINIPSNNDANTVAAFGTTVLIGTAGTGDLRIFDVTNPSLPSQIGFYNGTDDIKDIDLGNSNNYAFLATDANNAEFQVVDISNPASPFLLGSVDVPGNTDLNGLAYHALKDRVYAVGTSNSEELVVIAPQ